MDCMVISHRKKYCFIAVPKTGTSSITKHLLHNDEGSIRNSMEAREDARKIREHTSAAAIMGMLGEDVWSDYFSFAFVRNPWSRVVSTYHFYRSGRAAYQFRRFELKRPAAMINVILANTLSFKSWVRIHPGKPCLDYLISESGKILVNEVMKFEEMKDAYPAICNRLDLPHASLSFENQSEHKPYTSYYDEATKEVVARRYRKDIEAFGYTFEH